MANEKRVRSNFLGGLVEDNPLTSAATTLTSAALAAMGTIDTTNHAAIILDPDGINGAPEIAYVTAHTAAATTATVSRGQESTTARQHDRDVPWIHGPTSMDTVGSSAKAVGSAAQNITSTPAFVAWDAEEYDYDNYHDNVTNNSRLTVPTPGLYLVGFTVVHSTAAMGRLLCQLYKNGAVVAGGSTEADGGAGQYPTCSATAPSVCSTAGDYFQLNAFTVSATVAIQPTACSFWIVRLSR